MNLKKLFFKLCANLAGATYIFAFLLVGFLIYSSVVSSSLPYNSEGNFLSPDGLVVYHEQDALGQLIYALFFGVIGTCAWLLACFCKRRCKILANKI